MLLQCNFNDHKLFSQTKGSITTTAKAMRVSSHSERNAMERLALEVDTAVGVVGDPRGDGVDACGGGLGFTLGGVSPESSTTPTSAMQI